MAYYTTDNVDVTKRIEDGRTAKFSLDEKDKAEAHAKRTGSYVYELLFESRRVKRHQIGWGVPK